MTKTEQLIKDMRDEQRRMEAAQRRIALTLFRIKVRRDRYN